MDNDNDLKLPQDHPYLAAVAGWVHRTFFQPIDNFFERLSAKDTKDFCEQNIPPSERSN